MAICKHKSFKLFPEGDNVALTGIEILDLVSRHSVSLDGTWLKRECVGLESPVSLTPGQDSS